MIRTDHFSLEHLLEGTLFFGCLSFLLFFACPAIAQEAVEEKAAVSATVVKADFSQTIWAVKAEEDGNFSLSILVPNSGTLEGTDVSITVSTLVDWEVISMEPAGYAVAIVDKSPYNRIRWTLPRIDIGESIELTATFSTSRKVKTVPIEVKVESAVSAPVEVGTEIGEEESSLTSEEFFSTDDADPSWRARLLSWIRGFFNALAMWLNDFYDRWFL